MVKKVKNKTPWGPLLPYKFQTVKFILPLLVVLVISTLVILQFKLTRTNNTKIENITTSPLTNKPVIELDLEEIENVVKTLLLADNVVIYSDPMSADIDNDNQDEIIVFAYIVGGRYPLINGRLSTKDTAGSTDIIVLKNISGVTKIDSYARNVSILSSEPGIYAGNLFGDENKEIIVSSYSIHEENYINSFKIFYKKGLELVPVTFFGGEFDTFNSARGYLANDSFSANRLKISYGYDPGVYDTYEWDENLNAFVFKETSASPPKEIQNKVIEYVSENLDNIVRSNPILGATSFSNNYYQFYPGGVFMTNFSDGHILGVLIARYEMFGGSVIVKHIKEGSYDIDFIKKTREELRLSVENSESYFASRDPEIPWKYTPADIFLKN